MAPISEQEINSLLEAIPNLTGWILQQSLYDEKALLLQLTFENRRGWFCVSLKPGPPYFFFTENRIFLIKNLKKPLGLFLKTHFLDEEVLGMCRNERLGRVLEVQFSKGRKIVISFIPGRVNIEASFNDKTVFSYHPQELQVHNNIKKKSQERLRTHKDFEAIWKKKHELAKKDSLPELKNRIKKKKNGLLKMQEKLTELLKDDWLKMGEWLKANQTLEAIPDIFLSRINRKESFSWNLENAFRQAKKNRSKIDGTRERIRELQREIEALENGEVAQKKKAVLRVQNLLTLAEGKGRTIELAEGRLYIGRSGKENLKLLRKAKPWYIWLHIRDYPGAHGIIEPFKKRASVSEKILRQAARKVIAQSLSKAAAGYFEVIYTECRYVRPIKGAKSGQVAYSHEKVLGLRFES